MKAILMVMLALVMLLCKDAAAQYTKHSGKSSSSVYKSVYTNPYGFSHSGGSHSSMHGLRSGRSGLYGHSAGKGKKGGKKGFGGGKSGGKADMFGKSSSKKSGPTSTRHYSYH